MEATSQFLLGRKGLKGEMQVQKSWEIGTEETGRNPKGTEGLVPHSKKTHSAGKM